MINKNKKLIIDFIDYYNHPQKIIEILNGVKKFIKSTKNKFDIEIFSFCPDLTKNKNYLETVIQNSKLKNEKIIIKTNFSDVKNFLDQFKTADISVNMRYHGALLSMVYGIPSVNIIYDIHPHYPNKMNYLAKIFKKEKYFINFTNVNSKNIEKILLKANLNQTIIHKSLIKKEKQIKLELEKNYKQIFKK